MRSKILILASIFIFLVAAKIRAQKGNPYSDIGKKGEILTLTKGQFDEFFDEEDVQQIGTNLVNIRTMKIVKMLTNADAEKRLDNTTGKRFLSVDPITGKYPMLTPYQFASNRPIIAIDMDGLEATDVNTNKIKGEFGQTELAKINAKDYNPWMDLLAHRTPASVFKEANSRFWSRTFVDQKMSEASGDELNLDYYSVKINKLPPAFANSNELFEHIRTNFGDFKQGGGSTFEGYDSEENSIWNSGSPTSAIMQFHVFKGGINAEDMDVIGAKYSKDDNYWLFKPVYDIPLLGSYGDYAHPLAGYRQFGIASDDNGKTFTFYTRGVDRPYSILSTAISSTVFEGANKLWNAVMQNIVNYVNKTGGEATVGASSNKRVSYSNDISEKDKKTIKDSGN